MASAIPPFWNLSIKGQVLTLATLLFVVTNTIHSIVCWYRLRHVPGPWINAWTSWIQVWHMTRGSGHLYYHGLAKKYGPLLRVGPNQVMFTDSETCRRICSPRSKYTKGPYYEGTRAMPGKDHLASTIDEKKHSTLRRLLAPGYLGLENGGFEASVNRSIASFIAILEKNYLSTGSTLRPLEFAHRTQFFTLDAIADASYSQPFGFLSTNSDLFSFIHLTELAMPAFLGVLIIPGLYKWVQAWPINLLMPKIGDKGGLGGMVTLAKQFVDERFEEGAEPKRDILQSWIKHGVDREQLIQEICLQILAGSDTTATAIRQIMLFLLTSPPTLRRLRREIEQGVKEGKISAPITNAEALAMPYLQAVIWEGLRLYPPGVGAQYKQVPKGGDEVNGFWLPEATQVGVNLWGMQRQKEVYGEDADVFRAERWIEAGKERAAMMRDTVALVFGNGKYACLGRPMALMELNKIFVELLRRFDFAIINPVRPMELRNATLWLTSNFWLKVTRLED